MDYAVPRECKDCGHPLEVDRVGVDLGRADADNLDVIVTVGMKPHLCGGITVVLVPGMGRRHPIPGEH